MFKFAKEIHVNFIREKPKLPKEHKIKQNILPHYLPIMIRRLTKTPKQSLIASTGQERRQNID